MERKDLRTNIIPTKIDNMDQNLQTGNQEFDTRDLIYLDSYAEQYGEGFTDKKRRVSATDYAKMNNTCIYSDYKTRTGKDTTWVWLRSACLRWSVRTISYMGNWSYTSTRHLNGGLCPALHYKFPSNISTIQKEKDSKKIQFDIQQVKDESGNIIYYTVGLGEYPKTKADESLSKILESLYNEGKTKDEIIATGRWYSSNGQKESHKDYAGRHSPEFEYNGERYVRVVSYPNSSDSQYLDGTITGEKGTVRWVKVEPVSFIIRNWEEMPKEINPNGTGKATYFNLKAEEAITGNIPFYPDEDDQNSIMWQNSMIRGFFNGINVKNITQNGNSEYGATRGGNFIGECNFLNEAFNLSREPIIEYAIPGSETEIPDDAFNGCISLKKLTLHPRIKSIGKRAFEGLNFKLCYRLNTGELVFGEELPKNKENISEVVNLKKINEAFSGFDYNIQHIKLNEISELSQKLNKSKFAIPYVYAKILSQNGMVKSFYKNSDFRFFRNELPNINDELLDFPEEERLDFFKFASSLGCFSTEKMLDNKGKETETLLAQKATSTLVNLLKTKELKLRKISYII
ncbi:MAG: leucine-rich repeat protein [Clostridia bacterium]|nr:leucine-rich repeat protein [Clostridia bacterium]